MAPHLVSDVLGKLDCLRLGNRIQPRVRLLLLHGLEMVPLLRPSRR